MKHLSGSQILRCLSIKSIEIKANTHYHNCLSSKDVFCLKTTQPFFKSNCELHLTLWSFFLDVGIKAAFLSRNHRNVGRCPLPELPLWSTYHTKIYSAFLQNLFWNNTICYKGNIWQSILIFQMLSSSWSLIVNERSPMHSK